MRPAKINIAKFSEKSLRAGLTMKQFKFCEGYLKHYDAAKAYIEAGYTCKNRLVAQAGASRLLNDTPEVRAYITKAENEIIKTLQLNRGVLIKRAMEIALGQTDEEVVVVEAVGGVTKAKKIKKKPALKDQQNAIKFLNDYMDKVEEKTEQLNSGNKSTDDKILDALSKRDVVVTTPDNVEYEEDLEDASNKDDQTNNTVSQ